MRQVEKNKHLDLLFSTAELFKNDDFNLSHLFKIPYQNLMQIVYVLSKDIHVSYSDFNKMPWYEILMIVDEHSDFIERQNSESSDQNDMFAQQQAQMQNMYQNQQNSMPKFDSNSMPNFNNMNLPSFGK